MITIEPRWLIGISYDWKKIIWFFSENIIATEDPWNPFNNDNFCKCGSKFHNFAYKCIGYSFLTIILFVDQIKIWIKCILKFDPYGTQIVLWSWSVSYSDAKLILFIPVSSPKSRNELQLKACLGFPWNAWSAGQIWFIPGPWFLIEIWLAHWKLQHWGGKVSQGDRGRSSGSSGCHWGQKCIGVCTARGTVMSPWLVHKP